jgi:hypothetical protein
MKCPICNQEMKKVRWEITNNFKMAEDFAEYDKVTYQCKDDDVWVSTEIPMKQAEKSKQD